MIRLSPPIRPLRLLALGLLACASLPVLAQVVLHKSEPEEKLPEAPLPLENIEADRAWVRHRVEAATAGLADARAAQARAGDLRDSKEVELLATMVMVQNFRVLALRQHLDLLSEVELTRQELAQLRVEESAATVEAESGIVTIASALGHWQALGQFREEEEAEHIRSAMYVKGRQQSIELLKNAGQDYRRALESLESARTEDTRRLARENVGLERVAEEFAQERLAYFRARERAQGERSARNQIRGRLLETDLNTALRVLKLDHEELAARKESTEMELAETQAILASLAEEEAALQAAMERARAAAALSSGDPANAATNDGELRLLLEQAEILQATAEDISTLYLVWLNLELTWWERRYQLDTTPAPESLRDLPTSIADNIANAQDTQRLVELTRGEVDRRMANSDASAATPSPHTEASLSALTRRKKLLDRAGDAARRTADFLALWHAELALEKKEKAFATQGREWATAASDTVKRLWNYELFAVEDRITVDGEVLVEKRPVTFGKGVLALVVLAVGLVVAGWVGRLSGMLLAPVYRRRWGNRLILEKVIRAGTVLLAVIIALVTVRIPLTVFAFLGGALAIGVGFGAQNLINNFISGFILLAERPIRPGDIIEIENVRCRVETIGERCTRVRRFDGIEILIPNSQLLEQSVTNMTHSDERMRASIKVGVAYGSPTRHVQEVLAQIAVEHPLVLKEPKPMVIFESLGENALNFVLFFWVDLPAQPDWRMVASDLLHRICEIMAEEGIAIAFPQRDIHLDAARPIQVEVIGPPGNATMGK